MGQPLRILIDATMCTAGGGFSYLVNIIPLLATLAPEHRFLLLARNRRLATAMPEADNLDVRVLPPTGIVGRLRFAYFEAPRIAKRWNADLYYSAGETVPLHASCPSIASFQNPNVFSKEPVHRPWKQRARLGILRLLAAVSARCAARVMFVSHDSARWMGDALGLPEARRAPIQHGIDAALWSRPLDAPLHSAPYILSVSSIYRYKNYVRLIEAYAELAERRSQMPDLVIIGDDQDPEYSREMYRARDATGALAENIHILGEVPYADIQSYYAGASFFVFPSYLETFGIPLLEAMASGLPTVAADIPVFREVGGDAVLYADPHAVPALAKAMEQALFAPGLAGSLAKRGRERVQDFTWEHAATRLLSLFTEVSAEQEARSWSRPRPQTGMLEPVAIGE
ncbi:MAG: glycosyltransferase family 4 protein [Myxococcales bacterium]|nr:glycosyltransferase family 4 protein [Myxococcales bacterium]